MYKGLIFIVVLFVWLIGTLGAAGYLFYIGKTPCALAAIGNGILAYPTVKKWYKKATE